MYVNLGATSSQVGSTTNVIKADGTDVTAKAKSANAYSDVGSQWIDVTSEVGDIWSTFQITGTNGSTNPNIRAIEINGRIIVENYSGTTWNDIIEAIMELVAVPLTLVVLMVILLLMVVMIM